ncbi:hypothetical protein MHU86_22310 [Fragilaria crotonensis]|nr:hypothetical protein MHU86_22310 [Fragilaria crotonensis]
MQTSALQPIPGNNVAVFHTRSSAASVSSCENTVKANNRDVTLEQMIRAQSNQSINVLDVIQKQSFIAVWASIDQGQQEYLVFVLQSLVFTQAIEVEQAKEVAKAQLLSSMDYLLRYDETTEHASNVTQVTEFLIVLRSISDDAMKEMLAMTQPRPPEFPEDNTHDEEETPSRSTARGTIGSNDTTAGLTISSTGNARSMISTLTPEAGSTPIGADAGNAALKGCCAIS